MNTGRANRDLTAAVRILRVVTERGARLDGERRQLQVSDVLRAIEDQFHTAFPRRIWVCGSIRGLRRGALDLTTIDAEHGVAVDAFLLVENSESGLRTLPCELAEDARQVIDDSLRRLHDVAVDDLLVDGHYIRAGGLLSYDPERHCAILGVTALDPQPTAIWLAERREQVRAAAAHGRLAERQRDLRVATAPSSIALVAAEGDPALENAKQTLESSGFAVDVRIYAPTVAGSSAGDQLANGLREAALGGHDLVLLLRHGGRPLSLAPYDAEAVVRAVATSTTPILTGLGSPEEPAAADEVAHQAYATADEAADSVVRRLQRASDLVEDTVDALANAGDKALRRAALRLEQTRHALAESVRHATARANKARARRLLRLRILAAVIAAIVIVAAVVTQIWPILAALVVPLGLVLIGPRMRTKRREPAVVNQFTFNQSLSELSNIGRQLQESSDPDEVLRLEADADALAEHCRALLRRPRKLRVSAPAVSASRAETESSQQWPAVTANGSVIEAPVMESLSAATDVFPAPEPVDAELVADEPEQAANSFNRNGTAAYAANNAPNNAPDADADTVTTRSLDPDTSDPVTDEPPTQTLTLTSDPVHSEHQ